MIALQRLRRAMSCDRPSCRNFFLIRVGLLLSIAGGPAFGQELLHIDKFCSFYGEPIDSEIFGFPPDDAARRRIDHIANSAGMVNTFAVYAANVPNAVATTIDGKRAILYNQDFMIRTEKAGGKDWVALGILAHEIAHHIHGDLQGRQTASPAAETSADYFSGFQLRQMGASLDEAQAAVKKVSSEKGSSSHPPKSARVAAVTNGWGKADEREKEVTDTKQTTDRPKAPTSQQKIRRAPRQTDEAEKSSDDDSATSIVAEITIYGDMKRYFLGRDGIITTVTPFSQKPITYGHQLSSADSRWAWMIQTANGTYGVDASGIVVGTNSYGQLVQIGRVASR